MRNAEAAGRISLGLFFAETNGNQNIENARSNKYKGSLQTGPSEDQNGRNKWGSDKEVDNSLRSCTEPSRRQGRGTGRQSGSPVQPLDRRKRWPDERTRRPFPANTGDRENAPNPIDQLKLFELIQIIPTPTRSALKSGSLVDYRVSNRRSWISAKQQHLRLWTG
jgi:hypothetical protein